ncbi:MAG: 4-hydroxy-tetrahydrodipicolinate reductase [Tenericutes bacterium]|nr:4-hydroxy-tetrahydrodipicolinate reductase [Mycoplasmatota bacterium]
MKALVIGSLGKMGSLVKQLLEKDSFFDEVIGYDINNKENQSLIDYPKVDVVIDFSHPSLIEHILSYAKKNNSALVIATTGYSNHELQHIERAQNFIPIFMSSNFSFGIEVVTQALKHISKLIEADFDIEMIEKHHHHKIDAPSGTAIHLARTINDSLENPRTVINEHKQANSNDLAIHSIRSGSIVGEHTVIFAGQDETIEIKHTAQSKTIFAYGAIKAAKYLIERKPGRYTMEDLTKETNHE